MVLHLLAFVLMFSFQTAPAASPNANSATLPEGLTFNCWVHGNLSSNKSKVGDPVELEVVEDVKDAAGSVILPGKARLTGTVTLAEKKSKDKAGLAIRLTKAEWKNGSALMNGVFGGEVMVKSSMLQMSSSGSHMTSKVGAD